MAMILPKVLLGASLFFSLFACMGLCQETSCIQKLLPCQKYIGATAPVPPMCCEPLKDLLATDYRCLCDVLGNEALLKQFNVTRAEALNLPKLCGAKADVNLCSSTGNVAPTPAPPKTTVPPASDKGASSPSKNSTSGASYGKVLSSSVAVLACSYALVGLAF